MNLFWKKLFGSITSTDKFEKEIIQMQKDMQRYAQVGQSEELKEYNELFHIVNSGDFKEKKKTLGNRKYKDTEVYRDSRKFQALQNKSVVKTYYEVLNSKELKEFLDFERSSEYELLADKKLVSESAKLQAMKKFENSKAYKVYTRLHNSYLIKEYEELKDRVSSPEFKQQNEFWADKNRWQTMPEYKTEVRFNELAGSSNIKFYLAAQPERFEKYLTIKKVFDDDFKWESFPQSMWNYGYHYANPALIGDLSYTNEQQANNSGKNVHAKYGKLTIRTRQEMVKARAWDVNKGFIEKEFKYTSDIIQTAEKLRQQYGIFQAKIACKGKINHAFWLGSDNKTPFIKIFHYNGKAIKMGNFDETGDNEVQIKGLNPEKFFIYTLIWTEEEIIWMINNKVVHKATTHLPKEKMYLAFNSFITENQKPEAGALEVDWVRVYTNE